MKLVLALPNFCRAVDLVAPMADKRKLMTERTGIKIAADAGIAVFSASNAEQWGQITVPAVGTTPEPGVAIVSAEMLRQIAGAARGEQITLDADAKRMTLTAPGAGTWRLPVIEEQQPFPTIALPDPATRFTVLAGHLRKAIQATIYCTRKDTTATALSGVQMRSAPDNAAGLEFAATDQARATLVPVLCTPAGGVEALLPVPLLTALADALDNQDDAEVGVHLGREGIGFVLGPLMLGGRLLEATGFPNVRGIVMAEHPHRLLVGSPELEQAIRRVRLVLDEAPIVLTFFPVELVVSGSDVDGDGEATLSIEWKTTPTDQPIRMGFNPAFLLDYLKVAGDDLIEIGITDATRPIRLKAVEGPPCVLAPKKV